MGMSNKELAVELCSAMLNASAVANANKPPLKTVEPLTAEIVVAEVEKIAKLLAKIKEV